MADKPSSDQPGSIPKTPPKRPARDYSTLPQRPITLKKSVKKKSASKKKPSTKAKPLTTSRKKATTEIATPRVKKKSTGQWVLKGIPESTRQYAREEADRQGLTLEAWIEQLILSHQQSATGEQDENEAYLESDLEQIAESLYAIEQRLDRIEEQRGFWSRFWQQVMNQSKS